jgi:hypothetical protein
MANDVSRDSYRALGIVDPRFRDPDTCLWSAQSSYTQAGPRPGDPEPQQSTDMVLKSSGTQSASKTLNIKASRSGMPDGVATLLQKDSAASDYLGWSPPGILQAWQQVVYSALANTSYNRPDFVSLANGDIIAVHEYVTAATTYGVATRTFDASAGTWSSQTVIKSGAAFPTVAGGYFPCLCQLPEGRIMLYMLINDVDDTGSILQAYASDDDGATFSLVSASACTSSGIGINATRMSAAYSGGQVLLFISYDIDHVSNEGNNYEQLASTSLGASFDLVEDNDDTTTNFASVDVVGVPGGGFQVVFNGGPVASLRPYSSFLATAFQKMSASTLTILDSVAWGEADATYARYEYNEISVAIDPGGLVYAYGGTTNVNVRVSDDYGGTWAGSGTVYRSATTTTRLRYIRSRWVNGRVVFLHNSENSTNSDGSLGCLWAGGWTEHPSPKFHDSASITNGINDHNTWLPLDVPNTGWTETATGTESQTLSSGQMNISTGTGKVFWKVSPASSTVGGAWVALLVNSTSGSPEVGFTLRRARNSVYGYEVKVRVTTTTIFIDDNLGANLTSISTALPATGVQILLSIEADGTAVLRYGAYDPVNAELRFTGSYEMSSLTDDAGAAGWGSFLFGHMASGTGDSDWYWAQCGLQGLAQLPDSDLELMGLPVRSGGAYHIADGVRLQAVDGPTVGGDTWNIGTRYDNRIENLFPQVEPSPRVTWRSTSTAEQTIALQYDSGLTVESEPNDLIGWALLGINFKTAYLERYDVGTAAWVQIAAIDASGGFSLAYTRVGDTLIPNADTVLWLHENEAEGYTFQLDGTKFRKVDFSAAGKWSNRASRSVWRMRSQATRPVAPGRCGRTTSWSW